MVTGRQELDPETVVLEVSPCVSRKERLVSAPCPPHCSLKEVVTGRKVVTGREEETGREEGGWP